jgi:spermidine/putrescine transport system substrate-binding protein
MVIERRLSRRKLIGKGLRGGLGVAARGGLGTIAAACSSSTPTGGSTATSASLVEATPDGDLSYFSWAEFIHPKVVMAFEDKYGLKVNQTFFSNDDQMVAKLASGLAFDVVTTNSAYMTPLVEGGLLQPINHQALTNFGEVIPFFQDPPFDPGAQYSVPYAYGPTGIAWNTDHISSMTGSWNDLWDHPEAAGKIFVLDQIEEAIGMSLLRLGHDLNSGNADEVAAAADALIDLKPSLAGFSTDDYTNLSNGSAWIHHAWSGDVWYAMSLVDDPSTLEFQVNQEGVPLGSDQMSIAAASEHPGTALLFIDWMLDPENSAKNASWTGYANGTTAGNAALNEVLADVPFLQTSDDILSSASWKETLTGDRKRMWTQEWARIKAS